MYPPDQLYNIFDKRAATAELNFQNSIPWVKGVRRTAGRLDARKRINGSYQPSFHNRLINVGQRAGPALVAKSSN